MHDVLLASRCELKVTDVLVQVVEGASARSWRRREDCHTPKQSEHVHAGMKQCNTPCSQHAHRFLTAFHVIPQVDENKTCYVASQQQDEQRQKQDKRQGTRGLCILHPSIAARRP